MQEIQITGTSFLDDEEAQSYMGKFGFKNTTYVATIWTSQIPIGMWDVQIVAGDFPQLKLIEMWNLKMFQPIAFWCVQYDIVDP